MAEKSADGAGEERQATAAGAAGADAAAAAAAPGTPAAAGVVSQPQLRPLPRHSLYNTNKPSSPAPAAAKGSGSESESDIHEKIRRDQQDQDQDQDQTAASNEAASGVPPDAAAAESAAEVEAAAAAAEQIVVHLQLIPCAACAASASLAHCLTARDRNGNHHTPRLRVVRGKALRKRSKALLIHGEREPPLGAEDGSMEDLPLTPENMSLRFRVPCDLCTTLAMCANKHHPENVQTLAYMVEVPPGTGGVEYTDSSHHGAGAHRPAVGGVKEEVRELGGEGGERDGGGAGGAEEAAAAAGTPRANQGRARARRRVLEVEGKRVMMPNMISICDGVVLSLYLAPISIFSERREDVPGDLEIDEGMGNMSRGGYHFARMPSVTIANVLKLRALRDVISWKHNETKTVHRIVAAKVLSVWERHHPAEAKQLDELLRDGDVDKELGFQVGNAGPTAVYKASELRMIYARRATEAPLLIAGFTEEQLNAPTVAEGGEQFYADDLEGGEEEGSEAEEEEAAAAAAVAEGMGRGKRALSSSSDAAAGRAASSVLTGKRAYRRRSAVGGTPPPPPPPPTPTRSSSASPRPRMQRRSRVKEVVASDGKCYTLPLCVREKGKKLNLYVSLRAHRVDGDSLFTDPSAENAPLQRPYGRADITRENLLALRAVRDLVYRSPTVHPIIAADAFEIWENVHAAETPRPDDDTVVISGARTADGTCVPQETFTVGELRKLRGLERRKAVDDLLDSMLRSPSVMAGELEEATPTPAAAAAAAAASADARAEDLYGRGGGGGRGGGSSSSSSSASKKMKMSRHKLSGGGFAAAAVPAHEVPATAVSSCSYSSSSSVSSSPGGGSGRATTRASKRKKPSRLEDDEDEEEEEEEEEGGGGVSAMGRGPVGGSGAAAAVVGSRSSKRRSLGRVEEEGWASAAAAAATAAADPYPFYRQGKKPAEAKGRRKAGWRVEGGRGDKEDYDSDEDSDAEGEEEEEEEEVATAGGEQQQQRRRQGGGGGGGGGSPDDSLAGVRRDSWLQAVHENDGHLKLELERLRKERARVKEAHLARNVELMKWMVEEQSGMHGGNAGPPPRR